MAQDGNIPPSSSTFGDPLYQQDPSLYYNAMMQPMTTHINTRYKTQICRHFQINGFCQQAEKCQFAHGTQELRKPSDPLPPNLPILGPKLPYGGSSFKTVQCKYFQGKEYLSLAGYCKYGEKCTFAHGDERPPMMQQPQFSQYYGGQMPQDGYYMQAQGFGTGMQDMMMQQAPQLEPEVPDPSPPASKILDIVQLTNPTVQQKLKLIRESIDGGDHKGAEDKIWELYQLGFIVDYDLYQDYMRKIQAQQGE